MSLEFYRWLHIVGIVSLFASLAALWGARLASGNAKLDKTMGMLHGLALLLMLVSGFGMLARLGIMGGWPIWVVIKLVIWLALGASLTLAKRKADWGYALLVGWLVLGALAAYLGIFKPGYVS